MVKGILLVLTLTVVSALIGLAAVWGVWYMANPEPAPENIAAPLAGLMLGAPGGGAIGFISGTIFVIRRLRQTSNKA